MISNKPSIVGDEMVDNVRSAIEHRATWMYTLVDEMMSKGLSMDDARPAIFRCGCFHGETKYPKTNSLIEFNKAFMNELVLKVMEVNMKQSDTRLDIEFHYCPLVAAWQKLTGDEEKIAKLCDVAMDGDRGIVSTYPDFTLELGGTIAGGAPHCSLTITKK